MKNQALVCKHLWVSLLLSITTIKFWRFTTCPPSCPSSWIFPKNYFAQKLQQILLISVENMYLQLQVGIKLRIEFKRKKLKQILPVFYFKL